mmetsp:Transcript_31520/g.89489  ORF Transcript_31520/g.89489 Transcript_31520/m.89489 type:complete len:98 (+) Transcript_31520:504-797(+)
MEGRHGMAGAELTRKNREAEVRIPGRCCANWEPLYPRELAKADYDEHIAPLLVKHHDKLPKSMTLDAFHRAASLVASRAFGVDDWHGKGCNWPLTSL